MNIIFLIEVILIWYCNRYSTCERERVHIKEKDLQEPLRQTLHSFIHFSRGQRRPNALKKSRESHVVPIPSRFDTENRRNALMGLILIFKTPGSR